LCLEKLSVSELIQVCWSLDNPETEKREISGLIEAAEATDCKNLKLITANTEKDIQEGEFSISVVPAWKFCLIHHTLEET
jgi:predicted AAA+ superfamily ATPase